MNIFRLFLLIMVVSVTACGGGGASTTSTESELPSPVPKDLDGEDEVPDEDGQSPVTPDELQLLPKINLGGAQYADPNVLVTLNASVQAAEGAQITATLWTQVSGPTVRIPNPSELRNLVLLPDVSVATTVEFRFIAEDSEGRINSVTTSILIKPVPTFVKVIGGVFDEADEQAVFKIVLNAPSELPVNITYVTRAGTALEEADFNPVSGALTFEPGETSKEVLVNLVNDENEETDESFSLQVIALNGESTHANSGIVIIRNGAEPQLDQEIRFSNPGPVVITISDSYTNPLDPEVTPPGSGRVIYSSSDNSVATVHVDGLITPVGLGTTTITVLKLGDPVYRTAQDSFDVEVVAVVGLLPQSIKFNNSGVVTIYQDQTYNSALDTSVASPGTGAITYSSANSSVAGVDVNGVVSANSVGSTEITVTKAADDVYAAAEDFFTLNVLSRGNAPELSMMRVINVNPPSEIVGTIIIQSGENLTLMCSAIDSEDGLLPETAITWNSTLSGVITGGEVLNTNTLAIGDHIISCSATDKDGNTGSASARVLVGDVAPLGFVNATSTYCGGGEVGTLNCYDINKVNDGDLNTGLGGQFSWSNADDLRFTETYVSFGWERPVIINQVDLYTSEGYITTAYDVEYFDSETDSWVLLGKVAGNTALSSSVTFPETRVFEIRILFRSGSVIQPHIARLNELVVFGFEEFLTD